MALAWQPGHGFTSLMDKASIVGHTISLDSSSPHSSVVNFL